mgnify:FL=1
MLEKIHKVIQKRLFQKQKLLGREGNTPNTPVSLGGLTHDKLATRSTYIRMSSGLNKPVVLMSGELKEDGGIRGGYDEIYGKRGGSNNEFRRPMPGIKSVEAQFLGGDKALRQGTVSWVCWSFDDIERLTPHFLSVGKTVCIEWGWVYGTSTENIRGFIGKEGIKFNNVYSNYRGLVNAANGDMDMMVGIVKSFEYTTRADGGFDCTTVVSSVGTDLLKKPTPSKGATNMALRLDANKKESIEDLKQNLSDKKAGIDSFGRQFDPPDITLKSIIQELDEFLVKQVQKENGKLKEKNEEFNVANVESNLVGDAGNRYFVWEPKSFIISYQNKKTDGVLMDTIHDVWVRWGWFEDNILSKFESILAGKDNIIKSEFRSVERLEDEDGNLKGYQPTLIRDHKYLETVNTSKYILPGKLKPLKPIPIKNEFGKVEGKTPSDTLYLRKLAEIVNNEDNFSSFSTKNVDKPIIERALKPQRKDEVEDAGKGIFRNMLINTKVLKEAFGVGDGNSVESFSTYEALSRMFSILNEDIGFWEFQIRTDKIDTHRNKIVDAFVTDEKFPKYGPFTRSSGNALSRSVYNFGDDTFSPHGIFYFPVWRHDSLVKSQNLSCSTPNEVAISIMYGANAPKINTAGATESEANDEGAQLAGGIGKDKNDGGDLEDLQIALYKNLRYYGTKDTNEYDLNTKLSGLSRDGYGLTPNILEHFKDDAVKTRVDNRNKELKKIEDEKTQSAIDARVQTDLNNKINKRIPPPVPDALPPEERIKLATEQQKLNGVVLQDSSFTKLYASKFDQERRMKQEFIDGITYRTTYFTEKKTKSTESSEKDKPILIPISLELEIDGIGGIFPFECFHSTYLPMRYQKEALFQIFSVNHTINSTTWTTTIGGKMRSNINKVYEGEIIPKEIEGDLESFHAAKDAADAQDLRDRFFAPEQGPSAKEDNNRQKNTYYEFDRLKRADEALNEDVFTDEDFENG